MHSESRARPLIPDRAQRPALRKQLMRNQPALYRTPRKPGFVGGYNWKATIRGLAVLVLFNSLATQYIAWRFRYQPALGRALFSDRHTAWYQPFQWCVWGWRYCTTDQPWIRQPLYQGEMIALAGCFISVVLFCFFTNRRARELSEDAEDLHGSARFANEPDIHATGMVRSPGGVYVGGWYSQREGRLLYLRHDGPEHILAFAPTRMGKGVALVIPTLLAWEESVVVYDIKGENWAKTAGFRMRQGQVCFRFCPVEQRVSSRFNPLSEVRLYTARDVSDAQNIANMIIRTGEDSPQERYWQDAAYSVTTGMILHVCYAAQAEGRSANLSDLARVFTRPGEKFEDTLEELLSYPHDPEYKGKWTTPSGERTATHPVVREKVQEMLDKEEKDFGGVLSTAKTALALYSDPLVVKNIAASDFTISDLVNHDRPISLYLVVPPSDKIRLRPLIRLILTMVVNRLTERMEFEGFVQKVNKHRLLLLIDEFPSLNRMEIFADALSYMAGYGLKAYLITQDIRQIVEAYGPNESIVSNCHVRIAFAPNQYDTAELLSKMTGIMTVQKASYNFSGSRFAPVMGHVNASVDHVERPLMTPDEIMRIKPPKKKGCGAKEKIVAPGQMLIFVAGSFPILGTQMLYFADPILALRAQFAPPTEFPALRKPARLLSPPASVTEVEPDTTMEKGYIEELQIHLPFRD